MSIMEIQKKFYEEKTGGSVATIKLADENIADMLNDKQ